MDEVCSKLISKVFEISFVEDHVFIKFSSRSYCSIFLPFKIEFFPQQIYIGLSITLSSFTKQMYIHDIHNVHDTNTE
jgi:hypothetical protein